ncbi:MAG: hypothetical protein ACYSTF_08050 [Planctomycetota bacterium]|jgi:hypothetical protein
MSRIGKTTVMLMNILALLILPTAMAFANGGPFVVKYPDGDPAAKGVLARLDPDLKPALETRLRVVKEDLKLTFGKQHPKENPGLPLVHVTAEYTINNPTKNEIEVDFGFPILRGVYISPGLLEMGMGRSSPRVGVQVLLGRQRITPTIISNSAIYGIIRQRAREVIEKAVAENQTLASLVASVRGTKSEAREAARRALLLHLVNAMKWSERDAVLMLEYAALDFGKPKSHPPDRDHLAWGYGGGKLNELMNANLGPLTAIGEQKATQFFAQLASRFDPKAAAAYESIFTAWGGDVRERSVDLKTGKVRPREVTVDKEMLNKPAHHHVPDPTIYARVDYLDPKAKISESEKASCKVILKNLPVVFTFAPMNILHYNARFPAESTQTLTVTYRQYAYTDTRSPSSYQLAYVVHPASLWKNFGPINLEVAVPQGVSFQASVPCDNGGVEERPIFLNGRAKVSCDIYRAQLKQKTGELYVAVDADMWKNGSKPVAINVSQGQVQKAARSNVQTARY